MKAWLVETITEAGTLRLAELPTPVPADDEYLLKVEASGLNFLDTLVVRGQYQTKPPLPFVPGVEVVGRIVSGGPHAGALAIGTRVAAPVRFGGYAEYAVAKGAATVPINDAMPAAAAMALRGNYPTSLYALRDAARLRQGETLLVHAGAGGVGSAAVELGKMMGAKVIATAGGPDKVAACLAVGADHAIDYGEDWVASVRRLAPNGVDVIYDPVGGDVGAQSLRVLAWEARYLVIGFAGGALTSLPANRLLLHNASAIGVLWGAVRDRRPELATELTEILYQAYADGRLRPLDAHAFAFEQAPAALEALRSRRTTGKAILAH